jgi:hypothetical protein
LWAIQIDCIAAIYPYLSFLQDMKETLYEFGEDVEYTHSIQQDLLEMCNDIGHECDGSGTSRPCVLYRGSEEIKSHFASIVACLLADIKDRCISRYTVVRRRRAAALKRSPWHQRYFNIWRRYRYDEVFLLTIPRSGWTIYQKTHTVLKRLNEFLDVSKAHYLHHGGGKVTYNDVPSDLRGKTTIDTFVMDCRTIYHVTLATFSEAGLGRLPDAASGVVALYPTEDPMPTRPSYIGWSYRCLETINLSIKGPDSWKDPRAYEPRGVPVLLDGGGIMWIPAHFGASLDREMIVGTAMDWPRSVLRAYLRTMSPGYAERLPLEDRQLVWLWKTVFPYQTAIRLTNILHDSDVERNSIVNMLESLYKLNR